MKQRAGNLGERLRTAASSLPLDAKREPARHRGVEGSFPYCAGYAESLAHGVLGEVGEGMHLRVLDPWNGAGTTGQVAHVLGHDAVGFDINPLANLVALAKLAHSEDAENVIGLAKRWARRPDKVQEAEVMEHASLGEQLAAELMHAASRYQGRAAR